MLPFTRKARKDAFPVETINGRFTQVSFGNNFCAGIQASEGGIGPIVILYRGDHCNIAEPPAFNDFTQLVCGYAHIVGLRTNGSICVWGADGAGRHYYVPEEKKKFVKIACGDYHITGILDNGHVISWKIQPNNRKLTRTRHGVAIACGGYQSAAIIKHPHKFRKDKHYLITWGYTSMSIEEEYVKVVCDSQFTVAIRSDGSIDIFRFGERTHHQPGTFTQCLIVYKTIVVLTPTGHCKIWMYRSFTDTLKKLSQKRSHRYRKITKIGSKVYGLAYNNKVYALT